MTPLDLDALASDISVGIHGGDRFAALAALCALVAEIERLRGEAAQEREAERAAVVAWLREQGSINSMLSVMTGAADEIESGEHRREGGE